jgi:transposase
VAGRRGATLEEHAMRRSQKTAGIIATIGIDLAKNTFQVVGFEQRGVTVLQQKISRGQLERRLANIPRCLIGMEASADAFRFKAAV